MVIQHWTYVRVETILLPHGLLFSISSKDSFICTITTDRIAHTTTFVTSIHTHILTYTHRQTERQTERQTYICFFKGP